eukprot:361828-Chlamydomonas_euryale.AAC.1
MAACEPVTLPTAVAPARRDRSPHASIERIFRGSQSGLMWCEEPRGGQRRRSQLSLPASTYVLPVWRATPPARPYEEHRHNERAEALHVLRQ